MRARIRSAYTPEELTRIYARPHEHGQWPDHVLRVDTTIKLARELAARTGIPRTIADLSCGDAAIARALIPASVREHAASRLILGDIAPGYELHGPIEQTIAALDRVDLLICTETVEHLDNPDAVLAMLRAKAGSLVLSTPDSEPPGINAEHYWTWDQDGVREMLADAGWEPVLNRTVTWLDGNNWRWAYQIWGCE